MKLKELVSTMDRDTEFFIKSGGPELDGREICRLDGDIFADFADFDWLLEKEIKDVRINREWGAVEVTVYLQERYGGTIEMEG